jgi:hypothetical protein
VIDCEPLPTVFVTVYVTVIGEVAGERNAKFVVPPKLTLPLPATLEGLIAQPAGSLTDILTEALLVTPASAFTYVVDMEIDPPLLYPVPDECVAVS